MEVRISPQSEPPDSAMQTWLVRVCLVLIFLLAGFLAIRETNKSASIEGVVVFSRQTRGHDDTFVSQRIDLPPVGGVHHNLFQNCGIYSSPIESEKAVHSLEHGAVWITYEPGLPAADIVYLQEKVRDQEYVILSPYPGQRSPVVLTAWGAQLLIDSGRDERVGQFLARYILGPATPERGASCMGGFGTPIP